MRRLLLAMTTLFSITATLSAHHSITAVYDGRRSIDVDGVVAQFYFVNPHPYVIITVPEADGPASWHLEMDNRGELVAVGMTSQTLRAGDRVAVTGSPSRTDKRSLYVRKLVRPADGFEYEQVGSSPRIKSR